MCVCVFPGMEGRGGGEGEQDGCYLTERVAASTSGRLLGITCQSRASKLANCRQVCCPALRGTTQSPSFMPFTCGVPGGAYLINAPKAVTVAN